MKKFIIFILLANIAFANYVYENQGKGKIDMHGGKGDSLINDKSSFSNSNFNKLGTLGTKKDSISSKSETKIKTEKKH